MLSLLISLPIIGSLILLFIPKENVVYLRNLSLYFSLFTFLVSVLLWIEFDFFISKFQFVEKIYWLEFFNINCFLGIDGISLLFIILTTFLYPICILSSWKSINNFYKEFIIVFLMMESLLLIVFSILDLVLFYIFFESVLIPMFLIVGVWGSRRRKVRAAYMLFLYTLFGSVLMLLAILVIYFQAGTTDYQVLLTTTFSDNTQKLLWLAFFISFASKIPMVPVHIWLPEAHVEAPTIGSVILAGVLLKLGSYGFIRFSLPLFPVGTVYYTPIVYTIGVISIIYTSLTAIRQTDLKRIIAYASVAHMNLIILGLFSLNIQGVEGSVVQMISHGIVASALFLCVGVVYDRHHTRFLKYYSGLVQVMPVFITLFLIFSFANAALPGTCNFVGEVMLFTGVFQDNMVITFFSAIGIILSGVYSLWLFNRIAYGNIKVNFIKGFVDLSLREFMLFLPLVFFTILFGIYPEPIINKLHLVQVYF